MRSPRHARMCSRANAKAPMALSRLMRSAGASPDRRDSCAGGRRCVRGGPIINPKTASSQLMGGMIWGISAALHEATEIDKRHARYVNTNLADHLIPVNAHIGEIDVIMIPECDNVVNPLGIKGIGELGNVGMNAAVGNAVYHATGLRVREI